MPSLISMGRDVLIILEYFLHDASARLANGCLWLRMILSNLFYGTTGQGMLENSEPAERILGLPLNFEIRPQALTDLLDYDTAMMQFERNLLEQTLRETAGRKGEAAKL